MPFFRPLPDIVMPLVTFTAEKTLFT